MHERTDRILVENARSKKRLELKIQTNGVLHTQCKNGHGGRSMDAGEIIHGPLTFGLTQDQAAYLHY